MAVLDHCHDMIDCKGNLFLLNSDYLKANFCEVVWKYNVLIKYLKGVNFTRKWKRHRQKIMNCKKLLKMEWNYIQGKIY